MAHPNVQERLVICRSCEFWSGRCAKGFKINSHMGCPARKFDPVNNAGYAADVQISGVASSSGCCRQRPTVKFNLSVKDVADRFAVSMARWTKDGCKVVDSVVHSARFAACQSCPHYQHLVCQLCFCLPWIKTKLATERCPDNPPRWT